MIEPPSLSTLAKILIDLPDPTFARIVTRLAKMSKGQVPPDCDHLTFIDIGPGGPNMTLVFGEERRTFSAGDRFCYHCGINMRHRELPPMSSAANGPR